MAFFPRQLTASILFKLCCLQNHWCISAVFMLASADSVAAATVPVWCPAADQFWEISERRDIRGIYRILLPKHGGVPYLCGQELIIYAEAGGARDCGMNPVTRGRVFPSLPPPPLWRCAKIDVKYCGTSAARSSTSRRLNSPNIRDLPLFIYLFFCFISKMLPSPRQHCVGRGQQKCKIAFHLSNCLRKKNQQKKPRCYLMKSNESEKHYSPHRASARRMSEQPSSCPHCQSCVLLS